MDGVGTTWQNLNYLAVGNGSVGELNIQNGALVTSLNGHVGINNIGTVNINGAGSTWTNSTTLYIRANGNVNLAGGTINASTLWLAAGDLSGNGTVNANVTGSSTIHASGGQLVMGNTSSTTGFDFQGTINIDSGSTLIINDSDSALLGQLTILGDGLAAAALVAGNAQANDVGAHLILGSGDQMMGHGTIAGNFINQGMIAGVGTALSERLVFEADWTVSGTGTFENTLIQGTFAPGDSSAIITGTNQAFSGTIEMELGGLTAGFDSNSHDQIVDLGSLFLDNAQLFVSEWNGFVPEAGDSFTLFTWQDQLQGQLGSVVLDNFFQQNGIGFSLEYVNPDGAGSLVLTATSAVPEPKSIALLWMGCVLLTRWRRRKSTIDQV